jgi:Uma2 family endonuclease
MTTAFRFTSEDLECFPDLPGVRYEIIDGELYVSRVTDWRHQYTCGQVFAPLLDWSSRSGAGIPILTPGLVFAPDQDVIPDLIWISWERLRLVEDEKGHFRAAPELAVEVLSPGRANEVRDRELKLSLYSRQGVREYWILDWRLQSMEVYRRHDAALQLVATLTGGDVLTSPLLPGFSCPVSTLWPRPPAR